MTTEIKDRNFDCGIYIERPLDNTEQMGKEVAKILNANLDPQVAIAALDALKESNQYSVVVTNCVINPYPSSTYTVKKNTFWKWRL